MNPRALSAALTSAGRPLPLENALDTLSSGFLVLVLLLEPATADAQSPWVTDPAIQQRLASGEVVVATSAIDPAHPRGRVRAAVRIPAAPEEIWRVVTDCREALSFVPGLRRCRRLDGAADGAATVVEYEVYVDPGFWIPQTLVAHSLRRDIPAVLTGLRECVERDTGQRAER